MSEPVTLQEACIFRPQYDLVASQVEVCRAELKALVEQGHTRLVIDLAEVSMIDSKGLAVFMLCHQSLKAAGGSLTVVTDNRDFQQLFRVMRMDQHFKVVPKL